MIKGYFINQADTRPQESDIDTCAHCQRVLFLHPVPGQVCWAEDGGFCLAEMRRICGPCADRVLTHGCENFVRKIEQYTESRIKYHSFLKLAGLEPPAPPRALITGT